MPIKIGRGVEFHCTSCGLRAFVRDGFPLLNDCPHCGSFLNALRVGLEAYLVEIGSRIGSKPWRIGNARYDKIKRYKCDGCGVEWLSPDQSYGDNLRCSKCSIRYETKWLEVATIGVARLFSEE